VSIDDVRDATGWTLRTAVEVGTTALPNTDELLCLRCLQATTG
jgi:glutaconate CoA-transferase subunit B